MRVAAELFIQKGLARATVDDITSAAGVAKGTFYLYFPTKEAIVDALRADFAVDVARELEAVVPPEFPGGWRACTEQLVRRSLDYQIRNADLHRLVVETPHSHGAGDDSRLHRVSAALRAIIDAGIRAGAYRVGDPDATAWLVLDLLHAAGSRAVGPGRERVTRAAVEAVGRLLGLADEPN